MYTEFFNLREKPFELTSSPKFLYLGETHKEALALLTYGVVERKGFILLTGEVGTGKTTMIRALLAGLDDGVKFVHVSNPLFTPMDFMNYLASSTFKRKVHFKSKAAFLLEFEGFLRQCFQHRKNFILIVDEAQNLSLQLLEEIRLLSNLETADEKLINIFLVGQPELNEKLRRPECKPLLQRISVRHHIKPLDPEGTGEYIATRLELAGAEKPNKIFPADVGRLIHEFSGGYPRLINILADNALLLGYSRGKRKITPSIVKECYQDMRLEGPLAKIGRADKRDRSGGKQIKAPLRGRRWLWAALLLGLLGVIVADIRTGQNIIGRLTSVIATRVQEVMNKDSDSVTASAGGNVNAPIGADEQYVLDPPEINDLADMKKAQILEESIEAGEEVKKESVPPVEATNTSGELNRTEREREQDSLKTLVVKEGDTFSKLVLRVYGSMEQDILDFVREHNPEIKDVNSLAVGQRLVFPPLPVSAYAPVFTVHVASFEAFDQAFNMSQKLRRQGYDAFIMSAADEKRREFFRVAVGNFESKAGAGSYAEMILQKKLSKDAQVMEMETK